MISYLVLMEEHVTFWSLANPIYFWVNMDFSKEASSDYPNSFTISIMILFYFLIFSKNLLATMLKVSKNLISKC
jgi:hypothetical protein